MSQTFKFGEGSIDESPGFEIMFDVLTTENHCRHAVEIHADDARWDPTYRYCRRLLNDQWITAPQWIVPRVVVAHNEDGSAHVCLDCVIEAEKTLPNTKIALSAPMPDSGDDL